MASPVLRGVTCADYRSTLANLQAEGWLLERTAGGHIKLTHKEASTCVFGSSTPSDHLSRKNLISQCRRALRSPGEKGSGDAPEKVLDEADFQDILRRKKMSRKKNRKKSQRHGGAPRIESRTQPAPLLVQSEAPGKGATSFTVPARTSDTAIPLTATPKGDAAPAPKTAKPAARKPAASAATPKKIRKPKTQTKDTEMPEMDKPDMEKDAQEAVAKNVMSLPEGVGTITTDILNMALRIANGEMQKIVVTPEMVGQTIYVESAIILSDDQPSAAPAPAQRAARHTTPFEDRILDLLAEFSPDGLELSDMVDLLMEERGFKNQNSARTSIRRRLKALIARAMITETPKGDSAVYRIA